MEKQNIKRVFIWPVNIRLAHGLLIISLSGLAVSGWILKHVNEMYIPAFDYHFIFSLILVIALLIRLYGFIVKPTGVTSLRSLLPKRRDIAALLSVLRCYFSFGRFPLPNWHAHNPLWAPLYLLMYLFLAIQTAIGFLIYSGYHTAVVDLSAVHLWLTSAILGLVIVHIITAIVHDLKSGNADISAMVHGYRFFTINKAEIPSATQFVSMHEFQTKNKEEN